MIQIFKQTSRFSTPRMEDTPLVDFLAVICKHLDHRAEIWVEDFTTSTFPARWMHHVSLPHPMMQCHSASSITITNLCEKYTSNANQVENDNNHCFLLQYDHADIQDSMKTWWLIWQSTSTDFTLRHRVHVRDGPLMLYVCNSILSKLMQRTALLDARHVHKIVKQQLLTNSMVSCKHIPREQVSISPLPNGFSFLLTIRRLLLRQTLETTQYQTGNVMSQISASIDTLIRKALESKRKQHLQNVKSTAQRKTLPLPRPLWPCLSTATSFLCSSMPVLGWKSDQCNIIEEWLILSTLPEQGTGEGLSATTWMTS
jgi:hypothetical protein